MEPCAGLQKAGNAFVNPLKHLGPKTNEGFAERQAPDQYGHLLSWCKTVFMVRMTLHDKFDGHASTWQKTADYLQLTKHAGS